MAWRQWKPCSEHCFSLGYTVYKRYNSVKPRKTISLQVAFGGKWLDVPYDQMRCPRKFHDQAMPGSTSRDHGRWAPTSPSACHWPRTSAGWLGWLWDGYGMVMRWFWGWFFSFLCFKSAGLTWYNYTHIPHHISSHIMSYHDLSCVSQNTYIQYTSVLKVSINITIYMVV